MLVMGYDQFGYLNYSFSPARGVQTTTTLIWTFFKLHLIRHASHLVNKWDKAALKLPSMTPIMEEAKAYYCAVCEPILEPLPRLFSSKPRSLVHSSWANNRKNIGARCPTCGIVHETGSHPRHFRLCRRFVPRVSGTLASSMIICPCFTRARTLVPDIL